MKACSCWLSSDEIPAVFINRDAAIPISDLHKVWGVPKTKKPLFFSSMSLPLGMMLLGLRECFCPRADLQLGICARCSGHGHRQVSAGFSRLPHCGSMAMEVQNRQPWVTAEQGSHGWVCLPLSRKKKKKKSHWALPRGLGFTVISGEFRSMRRWGQILSQLIIKHPLHTTKSRDIVTHPI